MKKIFKRCLKIAAILVLIVLSLYYLYANIRFHKRVKIYNEMIQIGDSIDKVLSLMGKPTIYDDLYYIKQDGENKRTLRVIYEGKIYFMNDIILIFDYETAKLIQKERAMLFWEMMSLK